MSEGAPMMRNKEAREAEGEEMAADTGQAGEDTGEGGAAGDAEDRCDEDRCAEDRCDEEVIKVSRAPDGGWGWMVALGTFIVTTLLFSLPFSFGILFSGYLLAAGTSATTTAWIYNIFLLVLHSSMFLTNPLAREFGQRTVGGVSILMCSLAVLMSAFSPSVYFLFFSFSFVVGLGVGIGLGVCYQVLPPYFDKKSGKANTFLTTGACVAQMVFAPLLRLLLELYSYSGATLVYSAILLNGLLGVSFFHPVKWHLKAVLQPRQEAAQALMPRGDDSCPAAASTPEAPRRGSTQHASLSAPVKQQLQVLRRQSHASHASLASADVPNGVAVLAGEEEASAGPAASGCAGTLWHSLGRVAVTARTDLQVMRHLRSVIIAVSFTMTQSTHFNFLMLLPFVVRAADHSLQDAAFCISLLGIANFSLRFVLSPLADWRRFSIRASVMTGYCLKAAAAIVVSCTGELWLFTCASVMFGVGLASSVTLCNLVIIQYLGMDLLRQMVGAQGLVSSLGFLVIGPLLGVIRDKAGNFAVTLWVMAALDVASAGVWLLMPAAQARDARREHARNAAAC